MAFVPLDNTVKVSLEGYGVGGKPFAHVFYCNTSDPAGWVNAQRQKLAEFVRDELATGLQFVMSDDFAYSRVVVTTMETLPQSQTILTDDFPLIGGVTGEAMSSNVVFCVAHTTENIGRSFRGRTYHRGLPEAQVTANMLSSTTANAIVAAWENFTDALETDGDFRMVIASTWSGGSQRVTGVVTPVTGHQYTDLQVDTLRKGL